MPARRGRRAPHPGRATPAVPRRVSRASSGSTRWTAARASAGGRPDHQTKSASVAGPRVRKYRRASSSSARSRGQGAAGRGARASSSAYVADLPRGAPLQITPSSSARPSRCERRRPSAAAMPAASSAARSSSRVRCAAAAPARARARRGCAGTSARPGPARETGAPPAGPAPAQPAAATSAGRTAATSCHVHRIACVRMIAPASMARRIAASVTPGSAQAHADRPARAGGVLGLNRAHRRDQRRRIRVRVSRDPLSRQAVRGDPRGVGSSRLSRPRGHPSVLAPTSAGEAPAPLPAPPVPTSPAFAGEVRSALRLAHRRWERPPSRRLGGRGPDPAPIGADRFRGPGIRLGDGGVRRWRRPAGAASPGRTSGQRRCRSRNPSCPWWARSRHPAPRRPRHPARRLPRHRLSSSRQRRPRRRARRRRQWRCRRHRRARRSDRCTSS